MSKEIKKIHFKNGFSYRNGIDTVGKKIQVFEFDETTRTHLLNGFNHIITKAFPYEGDNALVRLYIDIGENLYNIEMNQDIQRAYGIKIADYYNHVYSFELETLANQIMNYIHDTFLSGSYDEILTLIEFVCNELHFTSLSNNTGGSESFNGMEYFNTLFKKDCVNYRFIDGVIVPITDEIELKAISEVESLDDKYITCKNHFEKSLKFLSDRNNPDYQNSVKESLTAVESLVKAVAGKDSNKLSDALNILEKKGVEIHPSLKEGLNKIYGYASDIEGARHGKSTTGTRIAFEDAKCVLVMCCALTNLIIAKFDGLKKEQI